MTEIYIFTSISLIIFVLTGFYTAYHARKINKTNTIMKFHYKTYLDDKRKLELGKNELMKNLIYYEVLRKNYYELYVEESKLDTDDYITVVTLQEALAIAIKNEEYEDAALIQKEIDKKKNINESKEI